MKRLVLPLFAQYSLVVVFLFGAVLIQGRWGYMFVVHRARPDLSVVVIGAASALLGWRRGAIFGLIGGLLSAALVPVNFGTQIVSSTLGGIITGWIPSFVAADSPVIALAAGIVCTSAVGICSVIMAPTHHLHVWAGGFCGELVFNTILTVPVYYLFKFLRIGTKQRQSLFSN